MNNQTFYSCILLLMLIGWGNAATGQSHKDILRIKQDNRWGAINREGQVIIPPKYEYLGDFNQHGVALFRTKTKYGAINLQNREVLPAIYDDIRIDSTEGIVVSKEGKWGILQLDGSQLFSIDYDKVMHAPHDHFWLWKGKKKGVANGKGKEVVPVIYDEVHIFSPQRFIVQLGNKVGLLDDIQGEILPVEYDSLRISSTLDKTIRIYIHGKSGLAAWDGSEIIEPSYKWIEPYPSHPYYLTYNEDRHVGLIEKHGLHVLDTVYRVIKVLPNGRIMAKQQGKWMGFTADGKVFTKKSWHEFEYFSEEYLILKKNQTHAGLYSFERDSLILPPEYVRFEYAFDDYIRAFKHGGSYLVHPDGQILTNNTYDSYIYLGQDLFGIKNEKNWGIMTKEGKVLAEPEYEKIFAFPKSLNVTLVKNHDKFGLINASGKLLCQTVYDQIEVYKNSQKAKAKQGNVVTIIEFNSNGVKTDSYKFENVLSVSVKSSVNAEQPMRFQLPSRQSFNTRRTSNTETNTSAAKQGDERGRAVNYGSFRNKWIRLQGTWIDTDEGGRYKNIPVDFFHHNIARVLMKNKYQLRFGFVNKKGAEYFVIPVKVNKRTTRKRIGFLGKFSDGLTRINLDGKLHYRNADVKSMRYDLTEDMHTFASQSLMYELDKAHILTYESAKTSIPVCSGGTWGFLDKNGRLVIPPIFEFVQNFRNGKAIAKRKGKWGVIDKNSKIIIPFKYDFIDYLPGSNGQFYVLEIHGKKHGFVDPLGNDVVPADHDHLNHFSEGLASVKSGHLWGFVNRAGAWVVKPKYLAVRDFGDGLAAVRTESGWGFIDRKGNIVIEPQFIRAGKFSSGLAPVKPKRGKSGFINKQGDFVIEPKFDRVSEFQYGRAMVKPPQKDWGMIDKSGAFILQPKYKRLEFAEDSGYVMANQNYLWGLTDLQGKKLTGFKYKKIGTFSEGFAPVQLKKGDKTLYGYIDRTGKLIIQAQYKKAGAFQEGKAIVSVNRKQYFYINTQGARPFNLEFKKATPFSEGKAIVWNNEDEGRFINQAGEQILQGDYKPIKNFSHGRAIVLARSYNPLTQKTIFNHYAIDSLGNLLPTTDLSFQSEFQHGVSFALREGKYGLVDINGIPLSSFKYDGFGKWKHGLCHVHVNTIKGIADSDGNLIALPKFHHIHYLGGGLFRMERADELGYLNSLGTWLWEIKK